MADLTMTHSTHDGSWHLLRRLYRMSLHRQLGLLIASLMCMAVIAAMVSAYTWLMGPLVDRVFIGKDATLLWMAAGAVILIFVVRSLATYLQGALLTVLGQNLVTDLQTALFDALISTSPARYEAAKGQVVSVFLYDVAVLRTTIANLLLRVGKDAMTVAGMITLMFATNAGMAVASLILAPLAVVAMLRMGHRLRTVSLATQAEIGLLAGAVRRAAVGSAVIRSFGFAENEQARIGLHADRAAEGLKSTTRIEAAILPVVDALGGLAMAAMVVYGGRQVVDGAMTPGALLVFVGAVYGAYQPLRSLARVSLDVQVGLAAAERVFKLIDGAAAATERTGGTPVPRVSGSIRFESVRLQHAGQEAAVLDGLSFEAPPGKVTALVGRTGAGKSSVLDLILGFHQAQQGRVWVNGVAVDAACLQSLRASIALVPQEAVLFDDSIADNIRYGRCDANDAAVATAARAAGVDGFTSQLVDGLTTPVGEGGMRLSGGQRQRVVIARALLRDAPIVLLDEATSAQDPDSARQIDQTLATLMHDRTVLMVAHRLASVRTADCIHVLDQGRIVESGTHDELISRGGRYAALNAAEQLIGSHERAA